MNKVDMICKHHDPTKQNPEPSSCPSYAKIAATGPSLQIDMDGNLELNQNKQDHEQPIDNASQESLEETPPQAQALRIHPRGSIKGIDGTQHRH